MIVVYLVSLVLWSHDHLVELKLAANKVLSQDYSSRYTAPTALGSKQAGGRANYSQRLLFNVINVFYSCHVFMF